MSLNIPILAILSYTLYFVSKLNILNLKLNVTSQKYLTVFTMFNKYTISLLLKYIIHVFHPFIKTPISKMYKHNIRLGNIYNLVPTFYWKLYLYYLMKYRMTILWQCTKIKIQTLKKIIFTVLDCCTGNIRNILFYKRLDVEEVTLMYINFVYTLTMSSIIVTDNMH